MVATRNLNETRMVRAPMIKFSDDVFSIQNSDVPSMFLAVPL